MFRCTQMMLATTLLLMGPVRTKRHYASFTTDTLNHMAVACSMFAVVIECLKMPFSSDIRFDNNP